MRFVKILAILSTVPDLSCAVIRSGTGKTERQLMIFSHLDWFMTFRCVCVCDQGRFSRFDRFLLIGPRAKGSPAFCLLTTAKLNFLSKLLVHSVGAGPRVFYVILRDQNDYQIFPTVSQNTV